ncbi:hypothetical protein [Actinomycetospora callitridis]|uniref:hypothetical protein n=1 Tax=Actinomycetospora callitridis TaxID=913944 RepID=UPI002366B997|nr:hypothetical protein [Actinomycetospora callitridis]MDD7919604.1 hypothetical protein [Actinomycetospora callitridis]
MENSEQWRRLVSAQDGLVTRRQALAHGWTPDAIAAQIEGGRWTLRKRGVLATFTGPLTPEARRRAALLFVRGPAALSHASAAALLGLRREDERGPVHVTVPYGSSARGCCDVVLHRSRAFAHITVDDDPPHVGKAHTILDLAVDAGDAREAMRVFTSLAAAARVPAQLLEEAIELRRPRRYLRPLRDTVTLLRDGVCSVLEADWALDVERAHGLPAPTRQFSVVVEGRRRAEDLLYVMARGELIVRLDGWRYHADKTTARSDRARDNAAELAHRARMTFGWEEVHHEPCEAAALVGLRLRELGWEDEPQRCTSCM